MNEPRDRRAEIIAATKRVVERDGFSGTSMRAVARELGYTTGIISHHFENKEALLAATVNVLFDPWNASVDRAFEEENAWDGLCLVFHENLPVDEATRAIPRLWAGFLLDVDKHPLPRDTYRRLYGALRERITALITKGQKSGHIRADVDAGLECDRLCGLMDGLGLTVAGEPDRFTRERLTALMGGQLDALKGS